MVNEALIAKGLLHYFHFRGHKKRTIFFVSHSQDDLWSSVVSCDHIRGHHKAGSRCSSQAKIQDLQCTVRLDNNVRGLQILQIFNKLHECVDQHCETLESMVLAWFETLRYVIQSVFQDAT